MSRRSILNITSCKKKRASVSYYNPGTASTNAPGPLTIPSNPSNSFNTANQTTSVIPWIPTAQDLTVAGPLPVREHQRSATTCYMRGLKETISLVPNTAIEWQWRRICFTARRANLTAANPPYGSSPSAGYVRLLDNYGNSGSSSSTGRNLYVRNIVEVLFKGELSLNWDDFFLAQTDTRRCDIKYDKTRYLRSGNAQAVSYNYKMWHPMNKNLVYDDEEYGADVTSSAFSVQDKRGMGDYFVIDFFRPVNGTATDTLTIRSNAMLYWHEKL